MYCDYCGYDYLKRKCTICGATIEVCGCDAGREVCERHYCASCQEAFGEDENFNEDRECEECQR